jgi:hypothetical protein
MNYCTHIELQYSTHIESIIRSLIDIRISIFDMRISRHRIYYTIHILILVYQPQ